MTNYDICSKAFHSLVDLALQGGSNTDPVSREEAWGYYMDAVDIIENKAKVSSVVLDNASLLMS